MMSDNHGYFYCNLPYATPPSMPRLRQQIPNRSPNYLKVLRSDRIHLRDPRYSDEDLGDQRSVSAGQNSGVADASQHPNQTGILWTVVANDGDDVLGTIKLEPINWANHYGEIDVSIEDDAAYESGYATEAITLVSEHAFSVLNLRRVTAGTSARDVLAVMAFQNAGFRIDKIWEDQYQTENGSEDRNCLSLASSSTPVTLEDKPFRSAILSGPNYRLVPFTDDLITDQYLGWLNDPEINRYLEVRYEAQTQASALRFLRSFDTLQPWYFWGIQSREDSSMIGTASLRADKANGTAETGLMVGEREYWGRGAGQETLDLLGQFGFSHLGLRKITAGTYAVNMSAIFIHKKMGMTREATVRRAHQLTDGKYVDLFRWGVFADEWIARHELTIEGNS
jgi:[ribosomal protein S5]-alanine N-acetyltransferase